MRFLAGRLSITGIALFCALTASAYAADIELRAALKRTNKTLEFDITPSFTAESCQFEIYAGPPSRKLNLRPTAGTRIASLMGKSGTSKIMLEDIPTLRPKKGNRSERIQFLVFANCHASGTEVSSNLASVSVKRAIGLGPRSVKQWLKEVRSQFGSVDLRFEDKFTASQFETPIGLQHLEDGSHRLFVLEQAGRIWSVDTENPSAPPKLFLDIQSKVLSGGERGLLGLAFHPLFTQNREFFLFYIDAATGSSVVARYVVDPNDPSKALADSEVRLIVVSQNTTIHYGGTVQFGPDGYLYISLGDGSPNRDNYGHAQNLKQLQGKILRIDVDQRGTEQYGIPPNNPFKGNSLGNREEIFAYGFRNPFRITFDSMTGELWAGDVGQDRFEEIDLVESGGNYGWSITEGKTCFRPAQGCNQKDLIAPVVTYGRGLGGSVIAGVVYRGTKIPALEGSLVFGDFVTGRIFTLRRNGDSVIQQLLIQSDHLPASFGIDTEGEVYVLSYLTGKVLKLVAK